MRQTSRPLIACDFACGNAMKNVNIDYKQSYLHCPSWFHLSKQHLTGTIMSSLSQLISSVKTTPLRNNVFLVTADFICQDMISRTIMSSLLQLISSVKTAPQRDNIVLTVTPELFPGGLLLTETVWTYFKPPVQSKFLLYFYKQTQLIWIMNVLKRQNYFCRFCLQV